MSWAWSSNFYQPSADVVDISVPQWKTTQVFEERKSEISRNSRLNGGKFMRRIQTRKWSEVQVYWTESRKLSYCSGIFRLWDYFGSYHGYLFFGLQLPRLEKMWVFNLSKQI